MRAVHTLVAEVFSDFIHTFKSAYDEPFQIQFGGDAQIHFLIKCVEMGDKWASRCTTGNILQGGRFYFGIACLVEHVTQCAQHGGALKKRVFHAFVHHEVYIPLAIAQFGVVKLIVSHAVFILHDGQRLKTFAQHRKFAGMNRYLARLRAKYKSAHADKVANIEQPFKHRVIKFLILAGANIIACDVHLNTPFRVL